MTQTLAHAATAFLQEGYEGAVAVLAMVWIFALAVAVFYIWVSWRIFTKARKPGWACLIPVYNIYVLLTIVGRPGWWLLLWLVPLVNVVIGIIVCIDLARSFGKGTGFGLGLFFLGFIFQPILAFGSATYLGPGAKK